MKKQKYDINKIYQKLISNEIPNGYVDFLVRRSFLEKQQDMAKYKQSEENEEGLLKRYYPKLYGKLL
ncbi:MAG: hypothetical protein IKV38_01135 [Clostridia bacterium]|nr:hypothetical protein [Clostridia bacterium]